MAVSMLIYYKNPSTVLGNNGDPCPGNHDEPLDGLGQTALTSSGDGYLVWYDETLDNGQGQQIGANATLAELQEASITIYASVDLDPSDLPPDGVYSNGKFDGSQLTDSDVFQVSSGQIQPNPTTCASTITQIGFEQSTYTFAETNQTETFQLGVIATNIFSQVDLSVTMTYSGSSVQLLTNTLTFNQSGTNYIEIEVNNDADSNNETLTLTLAETTSPSTGATITTPEANITILDDEGLTSPNGNYFVDVFYKNDVTVAGNGNDPCLSNHDDLYGINGTAADPGALSGQYRLYYSPSSPGAQIGMTLSQLFSNNIFTFITDTSGSPGEPPENGWISEVAFDNTVAGSIAPWRLQNGGRIDGQYPTPCVFDGLGYPEIRSLTAYFSPTDPNLPNGEYCAERGQVTFYYLSGTEFYSIEELIYNQENAGTPETLYIFETCPPPETVSISDLTTHPGMRPFGGQFAGYYGDDINEFYLFDTNGDWQHADGDSFDYQNFDSLSGVALNAYLPFKCANNIPSAGTEISLYYSNDAADYCDSAASTTFYYYYGGEVLTYDEIVNDYNIPLFTNLDDAVGFYYCPQTLTSGFAPLGYYGENTVFYTQFIGASGWGTTGNCILGGNLTPRSIDVNLAKCDASNNVLSICHYPKETTTLYYMAASAVDLITLAQYNIYLYTTEQAAINSDYNLIVGGGSDVLLMAADNSIVSNEYLQFTGGYYIGRDSSGNVQTTYQQIPNTAMTNGLTCPTVVRPSISEAEELSDGGYNAFYVFYGCNPTAIYQSSPTSFDAHSMYVVDGLHRFGETSPISDLIDYMKVQNKLVLSSADNGVCQCLEYVHRVYSDDIDAAKLLLENYYPNVVDVSPSEIGIGSLEVVSLFPDCGNCAIANSPLLYTMAEYETPAPIVPGPNMDIEKNYELDNVSKPLLRTNPKLSTNVKVVVDGLDNIYMDSFDANQNLADSKYKRYEISADSNYAYDVSRFYSDNKTPIDSTFDVFREYSDFSVLDQYRKQIEEMYQYGTKLNKSKLYDEEYRIFAPIWLDLNVPKKFVIYRLNDPNPDLDLGDGAADKKSRILKAVANSEIVKVFDLSKQSSIGKYLRSYVQDEFFPSSPITVTMEEGEKSTFNGIDLIKGGFVQKGEYIYDDYVKSDLSMIDANDFITDGFRRNKVACANLVNLEFMFDDPTADEYSVNRYFGLYVDDFDSGIGEVSYVQDGIIKFKDIDSYLQGGDPTFAIPEHTLLRDTGLLAYAKIRDDFYTLDPLKTYDAKKFNVSISAEDNIVKSKLGITSKEVSAELVNNPSADADYVKFKIVGTPGLNDSIKVSMIKKEAVRFKVIKNVNGETITITDFAGNYVEFSTGATGNDTWNNLSSKWSDITDDIANNTGIYSAAEHAFYNRYDLSLEITNQNNSIVFTERKSNLVDNELVVTSTGSTIIAADEIYTNVNPTIGNFFADISGVLGRKRFTNDSFSGLGSYSDIAFALSSAIRNNSGFDSYSIGDDVYVKSNVNGYDLKNATLLIRSSNLTQFIQAENVDTSNKLNLGDDILSLFNAHFFTGGNSAGKSVYVPAETVGVIEAGDFIPTNYTGVYNKVLHISDDTVNRNGTYKKLVLKDKNVLKTRDYNIFANNRITLGLFSAYDMYDMDFDFYSTSNSDLKELELENSTNVTYQPQVDSNDPAVILGVGTLEDSKNEIISPEFGDDPIDYFGNLLPLLKNEDSKTVEAEKIYSEYDRLKENYTKEKSTHSRVVPTINKWVLKDGTTVREEPYHLNTNEAFGRTNFSPDITKEGREPGSFTHEWFYIDNWPNYFMPDTVNSGNIEAYSDDFNKGFSYINFVNDFEITKSLFESTQYDYFDRFMVGEGTETSTFINDGGVLYNPIFWSKANLTKKYTLIDGGSDADFSSTIFKGLKFKFKKRKEDQSIVATEFVKNTDFNGYRFSVLAKTRTNSGTNSIDYEFIKNDKFKFIILMIDINIDDSFVNYINRKYLYELQHRIVSSFDTTGNPIYVYADVEIDGAIDVTNIQFNQPGPYVANGIEHNDGTLPKFDQQIAPGRDGTFGRIKIDYGQTYSPNGEDIFIDVVSVLGKDQLQISSPPYYIDTNTGLKVNLNPLAIPFSVQTAATYTYIGGGVNAYEVLFNQLSANYFSNLVNNNPGEVTFTTISENGTSLTNQYAVTLDDGNEIVKESTLVAVDDTNRPKSFKLSKDTIGYDIVSQNPYYPFLIRHNGNYTVGLKPVVTFTDVYSFNKVLRNQKDYEPFNRSLKEPYYKMRISSTYDIYKSLAFYNKFNRLGVAFNLGFISDGGEHDGDWGMIKNHFYHKVNEINTLSVTKLSESSEYLPQYPLIGEVAIDKKDVNVFKSSWEAGYYTRSLNGGGVDKVPGTISTLEEKSYLGSSAVKTKPSYSIYEFTTSSVNSETTLDGIKLKSNNTTDVVFFEDKDVILVDFYMDGLIAKIIGEDGLSETIEKFVDPSNSAGDKETVTDDIILYALDNMVPLYNIDSIDIYTNKFKGSGSEVVSSTSIDLIDNDGYESDNNFTYEVHGKKSLNFRLIYNKKLGYSYSIRALIKIQS
jgi:hypothetical protein